MTDRAAQVRDVIVFFALACGLTWLADVPLVLAWLRGVPPDETAMALTGLGAFGPTIAAFLIARRRSQLRDVFGRWRAPPGWVLLALVTPLLLHLPATLLELALGGRPAQWFYPPTAPEHVAGLIFFSIGEEFGWRGFAYPRLAALRGPVFAALVVGVVWAVWHLGMMFNPLRPTPTPATFLYYVALLALSSVVFAWAFERGHRSMAVAIAFHAGAHLDNVDRAPPDEVRLQMLRLLVVFVAACFAARALRRRAQ